MVGAYVAYSEVVNKIAIRGFLDHMVSFFVEKVYFGCIQKLILFKKGARND